ncbi:MAG: LysR family transcriptional regulator [Pseudolabrys sp.]
MKPDPRLLRYLRSIAEHGSFSQAAAAENISQPALSNKIALLEQQLGVSVMERGRHGATLNEYGTILLRYARAVDAMIDRAREEVEHKRHGDEGPLVVGATPATLVKLVPTAVGKLTAGQGRIAISIVEGDDEAIIDKLHAGEIDLMISASGSGTKYRGIVQETLLQLPMEVVVSTTNPLSKLKTASLDQLASQQWVFPPPDSIYRRHVAAIFLNAGVTFPESHWTCSSMMSLKSMIQYTHCIGIMPRHTFELERQSGFLQGIRLRDITAHRTVGVMRLRSRTLSPLAERFVEVLREVARDFD